MFMLKDDKCKCELKTTTKYATKYIIMFSKLSTYTYQKFTPTSMQEASTWWGKGV